MLKRLLLAFLLLVPAFSWAQEFGGLIVLESTITTTETAYADHDQIDSVKTLSNAFSGTSRKGVIESITVLDKVSQSSALTLYFFDESPTVASSDNAALNITDAELADKAVCKAEIAAASYQTFSASTLSSTLNVGCVVSSLSKDLFMVVQSAGTPDYTAGTDLVVKIGLRRL